MGTVSDVDSPCVMNGSMSMLGVRLVSQCETDEPAENAAGVYSRGRPELSVPAYWPVTEAAREASSSGAGLPRMRFSSAALIVVLPPLEHHQRSGEPCSQQNDQKQYKHGSGSHL